jgi:hypothetical protein
MECCSTFGALPSLPMGLSMSRFRKPWSTPSASSPSARRPHSRSRRLSRGPGSPAPLSLASLPSEARGLDDSGHDSLAQRLLELAPEPPDEQLQSSYKNWTTNCWTTCSTPTPSSTCKSHETNGWQNGLRGLCGMPLCGHPGAGRDPGTRRGWQSTRQRSSRRRVGACLRRGSSRCLKERRLPVLSMVRFIPHPTALAPYVILAKARIQSVSERETTGHPTEDCALQSNGFSKAVSTT